MATGKLCMICCVSFVTVKQENLDKINDDGGAEDEEVLPTLEDRVVESCSPCGGGDGYLDERHRADGKHNLKLLCDQLALVRFDGGNGNTFTTRGFFQALEFFQDSVSMCSDCSSSISLAMETNAAMEDVEGRVRQIQLQLLAELKELRRQVERFSVEADKLGALIRRSDLACLEACLNQAELLSSGKEQHGQDIFLFRDRISDLSVNLESFHRELVNRVHVLHATNTQDEVGTKSKVKKSVRLSPALKTDTKDKRSKKTKTGRSSKSESVPIPKLKTEALEPEPEPTVYCQVEMLEAASSEMDGSNHQPANYFASERVNPEPRRSQRQRTKASTNRSSKPEIMDQEIQRDGNDSNDADYFLLDDSSIASSSEESSDSDWKSQEEVCTKAGNESQFQSPTSITNNCNDPLAAYKERIFSRAQKRFQSNQTRQVGAKDHSSDPIYHYHIEYNAEKDAFTLAGIGITVDYEIGTLECSSCGYRPKNTITMTSNRSREEIYIEKCIYNHILGQHVGAFNCELCTAKFTSHKNFRLHMTNKHGNVEKLTLKRKKKAAPNCTKSVTRTRKNNSGLKKTKLPSTFKERFLVRAEKRCATNVRQVGRAPAYFKEDPMYLHNVVYNSETDVISYAGIQINIDEEEETLECSMCGYRPQMTSAATRREIEKYMERYMFSHILGKHVGAFNCKICGSDFQSHWGFREHLKMHDTQFTCDICGKPLHSRSVYPYHRWLHLSEEEKAEAIRNGEKNPREMHDKIKYGNDRPFQCSQCGKNFKTKHDLKQHEPTHESYENRERVVCPLCGKTLLRSCYDTYHKKHGCPALGEQPRVQCSQCSATFKTKMFLQRHMKRAHSSNATERPFLCQVCGKGFKAPGDLQFHVRIHSDERLWVCGKGCGKDFNVKRNWKRHEKTCRGLGGVPV